MMNGVGGTTLHYWAQSWRLNPWDFKVVSETTRRYGAGRVPEGSTVEDWPFGLDELEPYYDKVEYALGVSGQAGNVKGAIDPRGNIFEGARARAYPMPPLRGTEFTDLMGAHRRAPRLASVSRARRPSTRSSYQNRSACLYHGFCNRGGCHVGAKNSTAVSTIPRAEATGDLAVVTEAHVTRIDVDAEGRAAGVQYLKGGETYIQPAAVVLLAGYTYENTRLLLLSTSAAYPRGLANNRGQVGRHYFTHNQGGGVLALFPHRLNRWYGLPAQGVGRRRLGRRQLRSRAGSTSSAAAICGSTPTNGRSRPPACRRSGARRAGARSGSRSSARTRIVGSTRTCRRPRCRTRTTTSTCIRR